MRLAVPRSGPPGWRRSTRRYVTKGLDYCTSYTRVVRPVDLYSQALSCNLLSIIKTQLKIPSISLALDRKTKILVDFTLLLLAFPVLGATAKRSGTWSWAAQLQPPT